MARKLILSGVIGFAGRGTVAQSASAMLISFYFFDISFKYEPFEKPTLNRIKAFSEFQIFAILAVCTIIQAVSAGVDFDSEEALTMDGYGALLIILPHAGIRPDHGAEPTTMSLCQLVLFWQPALTSLCTTLHARRTAFHPVSYPAGAAARPGHEVVMDIIDEAIVMAYYEGCNDPLSTPSARCDSAYALWWSAPWLLYANTARIAANQTKLVTIGVGMADPRANTTATASPRLGSELELENYFAETLTAMHVLEGVGPAAAHAKGYAPGNFILTGGGGGGGGGGGVHQFAIFDAAEYSYVTKYGPPCPAAQPVCHSQNVSERPRRALWAYTGHDPRTGLGPDPMGNETATAAYLTWCASHGVTELYLMGACMDVTRRNATAWLALHDFIHTADKAGIDVQLYGGELIREVVPCTVGGMAFVREHLQLEQEGRLT